MPRMLRDVSRRDLGIELFGRRLPTPFLLAPIGVLELAHPEADLAVARAAAEEGVPFVFSSQASVYGLAKLLHPQRLRRREAWVGRWSAGPLDRPGASGLESDNVIATQLRHAPKSMSPSGASGRLRVRVARGAEVADVLDARWDALVAQAAIPNPTLTSAWLRELLPHARGRPLTVTVESEEGLVAGGLFEVLTVVRRGGPRLATLIAGGFSILYTDLPVTRDAPDAALLVADALLEEAHSFEILCTSEGVFANALA